MIKSAIRFIVHAMFGVGVLSAFGLLDPADAGQRGLAKPAKADAAQELRSGTDVDIEATPQSLAPRVLNRWDMNRRADASADATQAAGTAHAPPVAVAPSKGPVVVTIPTVPPAAVESAAPAVHAASMTLPADGAATATSGVVCLAGCR
jgi:hypothetical protein